MFKKLTNLNQKETFILDTNYYNLSGGFNLEITDNELYFTLENSTNITSLDNKKRNKSNGKDFAIQISELFKSEELKNYNRSEEKLNKCYLSEDNVFKLSKKLCFHSNIWIDHNNIPDYAIIKRKKNIHDSNGEIVYVYDFSKIKTLLLNYIPSQNNLIYESTIGNEFSYILNGLYLKSGTSVSANIINSSNSLDKYTFNQTGIFPEYINNGLICQNVFNINYYFNDTEEYDLHLYELSYLKIANTTKIKIDENKTLRNFGIYNYLPKNMNLLCEKFNNYITFIDKVGLIQRDKITYIIKDKQNYLYEVLPKDYEIGKAINCFYPMTDNILINNLICFDNETIVKNIIDIKDQDIHSNLKLTLTKKFRNGDYIGIRCNFLGKNKNKLEWRMYSSDNMNCDCKNNICYQPGYSIKFKTNNITKIKNGIRVKVDEYLHLQENAIINLQYDKTRISGKLYNILNSNTKKFTQFDIILDYDMDDYTNSIISFYYNNIPYYYSYFNSNEEPEVIVSNLSNMIDKFGNYQIPITSIKNKNSILLINKGKKSDFGKLELIYRFKKYSGIIVNDFFNIEDFELDTNLGNIEFTGSHSDNNMSFVLHKLNNLYSFINNDISYIKTEKGIFELKKYKANNSYIYHYNYVLSDIIDDNYIGYNIENNIPNNNISIENNSIQLYSKFEPEFIQAITIN